jgi:hypothetical protein
MDVTIGAVVADLGRFDTEPRSYELVGRLSVRALRVVVENGRLWAVTGLLERARGKSANDTVRGGVCGQRHHTLDQYVRWTRSLGGGSGGGGGGGSALRVVVGCADCQRKQDRGAAARGLWWEQLVDARSQRYAALGALLHYSGDGDGSGGIPWPACGRTMVMVAPEQKWAGVLAAAGEAAGAAHRAAVRDALAAGDAPPALTVSPSVRRAFAQLRATRSGGVGSLRTLWPVCSPLDPGRYASYRDWFASTQREYGGGRPRGDAARGPLRRRDMAFKTVTPGGKHELVPLQARAVGGDGTGPLLLADGDADEHEWGHPAMEAIRRQTMPVVTSHEPPPPPPPVTAAVASSGGGDGGGSSAPAADGSAAAATTATAAASASDGAPAPPRVLNDTGDRADDAEVVVDDGGDESDDGAEPLSPPREDDDAVVDDGLLSGGGGGSDGDAAWRSRCAAIADVTAPAAGHSFLAWLVKAERARLDEVARDTYHHTTPDARHCVTDLDLRDEVYTFALSTRADADGEPVDAAGNPLGGGVGDEDDEGGGRRGGGAHHGRGDTRRGGRRPQPPVSEEEDAHRATMRTALAARAAAVAAELTARGLTPGRLASLHGGNLFAPWSSATSALAEAAASNVGAHGKLPVADARNGYLTVDFGAAIPSLDGHGRVTGVQLRVLPETRHRAKPGVDYKSLPRFFTFGSHRPSAMSVAFTPLHTLPCGDEPLAVWVPVDAALVASGCVPPVAQSAAAAAASSRPPAVRARGDAPQYRIGLCEGALKPAITAAYLRQPVVGAWGGDFKSCRALLHTLAVLTRHTFGLDAPVAGVTVELFPDAGVAENADPAFKLLSAGAALTRAGYAVRVMWWGQYFKADRLRDLVAHAEEREHRHRRGGADMAAPTQGGIAAGADAFVRHLVALNRADPAAAERVTALAGCDIDDLLGRPGKGLRALVAAVGGAGATAAAASGAEPDVVALCTAARVLMQPLSLTDFYERVLCGGRPPANAADAVGGSSGSGSEGRLPIQPVAPALLQRCARLYLSAQRTMLYRLSGMTGLPMVSRYHRVSVGGSRKRKRGRLELHLPLPQQPSVAAGAATERATAGAAGGGSSGLAAAMTALSLQPSTAASSAAAPFPVAARAAAASTAAAVGDRIPRLRYLNTRLVERAADDRHGDGRLCYVMAETDVNPLGAPSQLSLQPAVASAAAAARDVGGSGGEARPSSLLSLPPPSPLPPQSLRMLSPFLWEQPLPLQPARLAHLPPAWLAEHLASCAARGKGAYDASAPESALHWAPPACAERDSWEFAYTAACWQRALTEPLPASARVPSRVPPAAAADYTDLVRQGWSFGPDALADLLRSASTEQQPGCLFLEDFDDADAWRYALPAPGDADDEAGGAGGVDAAAAAGSGAPPLAGRVHAAATTDGARPPPPQTLPAVDEDEGGGDDDGDDFTGFLRYRERRQQQLLQQQRLEPLDVDGGAGSAGGGAGEQHDTESAAVGAAADRRGLGSYSYLTREGPSGGDGGDGDNGGADGDGVLSPSRQRQQQQQEPQWQWELPGDGQLPPVHTLLTPAQLQLLRRCGVTADGADLFAAFLRHTEEEENEEHERADGAADEGLGGVDGGEDTGGADFATAAAAGTPSVPPPLLPPQPPPLGPPPAGVSDELWQALLAGSAADADAARALLDAGVGIDELLQLAQQLQHRGGAPQAEEDDHEHADGGGGGRAVAPASPPYEPGPPPEGVSEAQWRTLLLQDGGGGGAPEETDATACAEREADLRGLLEAGVPVEDLLRQLAATAALGGGGGDGGDDGDGGRAIAGTNAISAVRTTTTSAADTPVAEFARHFFADVGGLQEQLGLALLPPPPTREVAAATPAAATPQSALPPAARRRQHGQVPAAAVPRR